MTNVSKISVDIPGIDEEMRSAISEIIDDFESKHEQNVVNNGDGWVPRIEQIDYVIAAAINLVFIIWLFAALT